MFRAALVLGALSGAAILSGCSREVSAEITTYGGINAIRGAAGLPALQPDAALVRVARERSADMAAKGYFSHDPPDGCNYACIMRAEGVANAWGGENIAWNNWPWSRSAQVAIDMWHNSPPHMENILNCHYTRFGAGVVQAEDGNVYYTMIFEGNRAC
jgi:uncharacterized protein YkwD